MDDRQPEPRAASGGTGPGAALGPLWESPPAPPRPGLTRAAIVGAAIDIADREGLDAVSIRRVAAVLDARPMSLYTHVPSKDDLLDLMTDRVAGEAVLTEALPTDWRAALRAIAARSREVGLRHTWMLRSVVKRGNIGPNAVRHIEQSFEALAGLRVETSRKIEILRAVDTFVIGHILGEVSARKREGQQVCAADGPAPDRSAEPRWQAVVEHLHQLAASGQHPALAEVLTEPLTLSGGHADRAFEQGLDWLLSGIAATLPPDAAVA
ncbi:TetR/AcrR family transcriptional regulator [Frankia sp. Mgl5]|uniref:TetR/AcrR family transcriptional regulator n=1 Tax=Frankia sp. Mgl5 TaxID=2933793 RepID=UPI00200BF44C|nr:TetR/AcrR family transcriptional regulator [Frankia sp. Mgl5]MCK9931936.1 TetR/AcrR family transcriptional regulator [Frankia sp. Mgl5]